ncbi:hypothetical protein H6F32_08120 [Anabaena sp. FACHB-1237]|uniref:hypothetical protein n=1 Tax=Anabaena sp. FACHB-1237 TaxID=2692769 RepID=UPI001680E477|nr:hypothetical protein [Anabaena sp. FACHB-1237]MBD2137550.1 hypothetical protein [Anabaena sp. FACHB-1237]
MTTNLSSTSQPDFLIPLTQTAICYRENQPLPPAVIIVDALLQAENYAKKQKVKYNFSLLNGKWRLCFATGTKKARAKGGIILGQGRYVPKFVPIHITFSSSLENDTMLKGTITNQVQLGSMLLQLSGLTKYLDKKNILAFDFLQMQLSLFTKTIFTKSISSTGENQDFHENPIGKLPFFSFFLVTENMIAARGKGGGLALWIREKS